MIGSLPHTDPQRAVDLVLEKLGEAPIWPELPRHSFLEEFIPAHVAGLPGLQIDQAAKKVFIDTRAADLAEQMAAFYDLALAAGAGGDLGPFALAPENASAFVPFREALAAQGQRLPCVKTHCVGPVSLQLILTDADDRPLYYDDQYQDVLVQQVALRTRWAVRQMAPFADRVIAFFDEPSLAAFGSSAYVGVSREGVIARLGAAIEMVKREGAFVGVHVCGNSDWPMILDAGADLLNYDAFGYGDSLALYADRIGPHLAAGGVVAFGLVPTSEAIRSTSAAVLETRFFSLVEGLVARGIDRDLVLEQAMLTPSCGMGTLTLTDAEQVVHTLAELGERVQGRIR